MYQQKYAACTEDTTKVDVLSIYAHSRVQTMDLFGFWS